MRSSVQAPRRPIGTYSGRAPLFLVVVAVALVGSVASATAQEALFHEPFDSIEAWRALPSEGVEAQLSSVPGQTGAALRIDYRFAKGSGFVVVRRAAEIALPENYRFAFQVRGDGPPNNLEFKLIDPSGDNTWWINRLAYDPPAEWTPLLQRQRQIQFAWGPQGGGRPERLGYIEFAIAASAGGEGTIWLDELRLDAVPVVPDPPPAPELSASVGAVPARLPDDGRMDWAVAAGDGAATLTLDLRLLREVGGLRLDWGAERPAAYAVELSEDGEAWRTARDVRAAGGRRDWIALTNADARYVRVALPAAERPARLERVELLDVAFGDSPNEMLKAMAAASPRGWFPRPFLGEQQFWTVVGNPDDRWELLLDEAGAVEVERRGWRIEPMLRIDGALVTWADVRTETALAEGYLPLPEVVWRDAAVTLRVTPVADVAGDETRMLIRYALRNESERPVAGELDLLVRPYQVLPPWQALNLVGGAAVVRELAVAEGGLEVDGRRLKWSRSPERVGVAAFGLADVVERLAVGELPTGRAASDAAGLAAGVLAYPFALAPGAEAEVVLELPAEGAARGAGEVVDGAAFERARAAARERWVVALGETELLVPARWRLWADTWRSTYAYVLINADGPAIQPGSRTYERSWIRDGAMTSAALLWAGQRERVRAFIDWYAPYQYESGKVPCVVDHRGPDPVDEHDSTGELLFLMAEYYRHTGDRALLERHFERVVAAVEYIEALRAQRMTAVYREGTPEQRACYGLVPESISHEGYSAKPMHSYWDSLWVVRGLKDAVEIAEVLGRERLAARFAAVRDDYRQALHDSIVLAMRNTGVDYVPGCVELGDFDATSTAIAYYPCDEAAHLPQAALARTFEKYLVFFRARRDGELAWRDYTPYELRLMQTFVLMGQREVAHELGRYFFADQRPAGWNHWAEVVHREARFPGYVGDMPHTWCGSAFMNAMRAMLVYPEGDALVLAGGVTAEWLASGEAIGVRGLSTPFGPLSYTLRERGDAIELELDGRFGGRLAGFVLRLPAGYAVEPDDDAGGWVRGAAGGELKIAPRPGRVRLRVLARE